MNHYRNFLLAVFLFFCGVNADAQRAEVAITLNEHFFDTVVDALFQNGAPPEFAIAENRPAFDAGPGDVGRDSIAGARSASFISTSSAPPCRESIRLQREMDGVRTAVRFREGKIYAPLAFTGNYNPPLVGCVAFAGWAESNIDLVFDEANQRVVANARVLNVSLSGTGGVGGSVIARMVQSSIDRKINPIEIFRMDKLSFLVPIQNSAQMRMRAVGVRHEIADGTLIVHIAYEFSKAS
jgi:hypothetical protein